MNLNPKIAIAVMTAGVIGCFQGMFRPNFFGHYDSKPCKSRQSAFAYYHLTLEERRAKHRRERQARRRGRQLCN
jgi:hypothetical protein